MEESQVYRYDDHRWRDDDVAFAEVYKKKCEEESKLNNKIDKELHAELVKLDTRLELKTITI